MSMPFAITDAAGVTVDPASDSDERAELRRTVRAVVERESPDERIRALDEAEAFDERLYDSLAGIGALAIGAADELGDLRDQLVVVEELAAGPTSMAAFMIGHYAVTGALRRFGATDQHRDVLDQLT